MCPLWVPAIRWRVSKRIGIIASSDDPLVAEVIRRVPPGVAAEFAEIGGTSARHVSRYAVIFDRLSHRVPHYRYYLKAAALAGATVINDPFWSSADDPFFAHALAARLGLSTPRAVMLPQKSYHEAVDTTRELKNLQYPLNWQSITDYVRWPAVLEGLEGQLAPIRVDDMPSLWAAYDESGAEPTVLRQHCSADRRVRAVCIDGEVVLAAGRPERQSPAMRAMPEADGAMLKSAARRFTEALGYPFSAVELALHGTEVMVLTAPDPFFTCSSDELGESSFIEVAEKLSQLLFSLVHGRALTIAPYGWSERFTPGGKRPISGA